MGDSEMPLVLVVEDDPDARAIIQRWLGSDYEVVTFGDAESCIKELDVVQPDVVCLDLELPGLDGLDAMGRIFERHPQVPLIITTADRDVETVVTAMRSGAYDYLPKPMNRGKLVTAVRNACERTEMLRKLRELEHQVGESGYSGIVGKSRPIRRLFREIQSVAPSDVGVLIQGESGTGKELVARALHDGSRRRQGPFVAINCAAIASNLLESEFFGHERGAFTGAHSQHKGRLEQADGGTLFLDEIAELEPSLQAKLLRALQERTFRRLGGVAEIQSDFRVIAATHQDLAHLASEGVFRQDLYFRLAVFELLIPPLREREDDAILLASRFIEKHADGPPPGMSSHVLSLIKSYSWPGNVRELQNAVQRALVVCQDGVIHVHDFPPRLREAAGAAESLPPPTVGSLRPPAITQRLEDMEKTALVRALDEASGNVAEAARRLGIGRTTVYRKLKRFGIQVS